MSWVITGGNTYTPMDSDAAAYIAAVEGVSGDNQALEPAVRCAIDQFVLGCKTDGIWNAIKASCILAGARTLSGALVPLAGTAPTNNNFVSGDYNRKTGLVGDGSTKYLNSNRNNNADPQNSKHMAFFATTRTTVTGRGFIGTPTVVSGGSWIAISGSGSFPLLVRINAASSSGDISASSIPVANTFIGGNRATSSQQQVRINGSTFSYSQASVNSSSEDIRVFGGAGALSNDSRLAFYSIGESLNLALLNARVTTLINAFDAAI
jgi:hypothetical protein